MNQKSIDNNPLLVDEQKVIEALKRCNNLIVSAPTGSGKSTRIPIALARAFGRTLVLEPRRVAARSLSRYVAEQYQCHFGDEVGYVVRFEHFASPNAYLVYATTGVFLETLARAPKEASSYSVLVFDEFHERSLEMDVCLGMALKLQKERPHLKLVVMSATLESKALQQYLQAEVIDFGSAAIQELPDRDLVFNGRHFVEVTYGNGSSYTSIAEIIASLDQLEEERNDLRRNGAVLVFQPGKREINDCIDVILQKCPRAYCLPLHGEQSPEEQDRVFAPPPEDKRLVIVSTNVAEASITIPSVTYVIDNGEEKVAEFCSRTGISALVTHPISRASATQRAGRAGRTGPGIVFRLWTREAHAQRPPARLPEILRADLSMVLLRLRAAGVRLEDLHLLDQPQPQRVHHALHVLRWIGALDDQLNLTAMGERMAHLPLEPRLARSVLEAMDRGGLRIVVEAAAAHAAGNLYVPLREDDYSPESTAARQARAELRHEAIKFGADWFEQLAAFRLALNDRHAAKIAKINLRRVDEALQIRDQLLGVLANFGVHVSEDDDDPYAARIAWIAGTADRVFLHNGRSMIPVHRLPDADTQQQFNSVAHRLSRWSALYIVSPLSVTAMSMRMVNGRLGIFSVLEHLTRFDDLWHTDMLSLPGLEANHTVEIDDRYGHLYVRVRHQVQFGSLMMHLMHEHSSINDILWYLLTAPETIITFTNGGMSDVQRWFEFKRTFVSMQSMLRKSVPSRQQWRARDALIKNISEFVSRFGWRELIEASQNHHWVRNRVTESFSNLSLSR